MKLIIGLLAFFVVLHETNGLATQPPYLPSTVISGITWDTSSIVTQANGSDNFPTTWGPDGQIYTAWGDGGGFGGSDAGLGVARIVGPPESFSATNLWSVPRGYTGGKSYGILSVEGVLYMWVGPNSGWTGNTETWLMWSDDLGVTWQSSSIFFRYTDGFSVPAFLNFGQNYAGARDNFIYSYSYDTSTGSNGPWYDINLARVSKNQIKNRAAYEFYQGLDSDGNAVWTTDISQKQPVFSEQDSWVGLVSVNYNPVLNRYFLVTTHGSAGTMHPSQGGLGIFDAPEPWGPWTTVEYTDRWLGGTSLFFANFPNKWVSSDGLTMSLIYTGYGSVVKDAYQHITGVLTLSGSSDSSPPSTPGGLSASAASNSQIDLTWSAASDPETGVSNYKLYRNGTSIASPPGTSYSDTGLSEGTSYSYEVSAVNGQGQEGSRSAVVSSSTLGDTTAPTIAAVSAPSALSVVVVFDEAVEAVSASNPANYVINNGISVSSAVLAVDLMTVTLVTSTQTEGSSYQITVNNVKDRATTQNTIASNSTTNYSFISSLIVNNLSVTSGKTYEVVQGGFVDTALVYLDRSYQFSVTPSGYSGRLVIKTWNDDKGSTGNGFLTFDVNQDVVVYVARDDRLGANPGWMSGFDDARQNVLIAGQSHSLWRKDFSAGSISLGGNEGSSGSMYSVVIFKLGDAPAIDMTPPNIPSGLGVQ